MNRSLIEAPHGIYRHGCINCGGETSDLRLFHMLPCERCLPLHVSDAAAFMKEPSHIKVIELMEKLGKLRNLRLLKTLISELNEVNGLFEKLIGNKMWNAQETWAKRVLKGQSFSIVAPTGVGKTAFAMVMATYFALKNQKSYIILPTTPLVIQVYGRLKEFVEKLNTSINVITYHAKLSSKGKKEALENIEKGNFYVLVTTSRFLTAHYEKLLGKKFKFIVVDDVDAILKSSKNIDRILMIMGFSQEDIDLAYKLIKAKRRISTLKPGTEDYQKLFKEIRKLQFHVEKASKKAKTVLIVSSATGRPRGLRVKLFRELLGFEAGTRSEFLRAIIDSYVKPKDSVEDEVVRVAKLLGKGGLIFVPVDKGVEYAEVLAKRISEEGVSAKVFTSKEIKALEEFSKGEIEVLVGVATYYGVMVRGLDLPETVRYAIFAGIPRFKFSTKLEEPHPLNIMRALVIVREVVEEPSEREIIDKLIVKMRKYLAIAPPAAINEIAEKLREGRKPETDVEKVFFEALKHARRLMEDPEVKRKIRELREIAVTEENGKMHILVPDVMTYIQASGRTSRMFVGGITKGLSVVIVDDDRLFYGLSRRLKWIIEEAEFVEFEKLNVKKVLDEINRDRELVKAVREGKVKIEKAREWFKTVLLVVESPNKARTIANFFGKPTIRRRGDLKVYEITTGKYLLMITAIGGHVFDLAITPGFHGVYTPKDNYVDTYLPVYDTIKRCLDCGYQFTEYPEEKGKTCPRCGSKNVRDSLDIINFIKELAEEVDLVLIGTDPDTEGEKIGWDIAVHLRPHAKKLLRIEFHEVTKRAITEALDNPREFNRFLVEAQVVRRVEDRWIGFELSRRLWKIFGKHWLSAGRVQTPVLGWIIKQHKKWKEEREEYVVITVDNLFRLEIPKSEVKGGLEKVGEISVEVVDMGVEESTISPPPPFTTDTMLTEASQKLGLGANEIMQLAQDLFEQGFITYHRTDSVRVSSFGQYVAKAYLEDSFGVEASELYKPRGWGVGGAHECIRPTRPIDTERLLKLINEGVITPIKPLTRNHIKLYDLIFRRFIASQMVEAKVLKQKANVKILGTSRELERVVDIVKPGFLKIYPMVKTESYVKPGKYVGRMEIIEKPKVSLFTQGDVVKLMRERGIGRPSTYAKIIQTLLQRNYVIESKRMKKLIPTDLGIKVYTYLSQNYFQLISEERTAMLEKIMDEIEEGKRDYIEVLNELYKEIKSIP